MSPGTILQFKLMMRLVLAGAGVVAAFALWIVAYRDVTRKAAVRILGLILAVMAVISTGIYFEFGLFRYGRYINPHDTFHYYMGAKYSREIGYSHLYASALVADMDGRRLYSPNSTIRSQKDYGYTPVRTVLAEADRYRAMFSPERWQEFKKDIEFFQSIMPREKWNAVLKDKGYNATPVWNMVARFLSNHFPTQSWMSMWFLLGLDLLLLTVMFLLVYAAFGWNAAMLAIVFWGINFFMSFVHIKGAFLRLDWVTLLVMAICLLKLERYKTAGVLAAYAALARVFPVVFVFGVGAKMIWEFLSTRKIPRRYIEFFVAFTLMILVLTGVSVVSDGDLHLWKEFGEKISLHNNDLSTTRVGFKYIFLDTKRLDAPWNAFVLAKQKEFADRKVSWLAIQAAVLAVCFLAMRKLDDHEALALSFVPVFFLTAPTFYYFVMLIIPFMFALARPDSVWRMLTLVAFFVLTLVAHVLSRSYQLNLYLCYILSWALFSLCACLLIAAFFTSKKENVTGKVSPTISRFVGALIAGLLAGWTVYGLCTCRVHAVPSNTPQKAAPLSQGDSPARNQAVLAFTGDVMLSRNVLKSLDAANPDFTIPFSSMAPYLKQADIAFCNLECPISDQGTKIEKRYTFKAPSGAVKGLVFAGFDLVALANNHVLDYGQQALTDTVAFLDQAGIRHVGIADNNAPQTPVIIESKGIKIGFLGYTDPETPYAYAKEYDLFTTRPAKATADRCRDDILALKPKVDLVVVSMHWGIEYETATSPRQIEFGHFLIDAGAKIVAGHHPHVQQEPEWYRDGAIIYSMGNFVFDQWSRPATRVSRLYRALVEKGRVDSLEYLPLEIEQGTWIVKPVSDRFVPVPRQK